MWKNEYFIPSGIVDILLIIFRDSKYVPGYRAPARISNFFLFSVMTGIWFNCRGARFFRLLIIVCSWLMDEPQSTAGFCH